MEKLKTLIQQTLKEMSATGGSATFSPGAGEQYSTPFAFGNNKKALKYYYKLGYKLAPTKKQNQITEEKFDVESYIQSTGAKEPELKLHITGRILGFDELETKLNQLVPLLKKAKQDTIKYYQTNPNFEVLYGTELASSYLDDLIELFKPEIEQK